MVKGLVISNAQPLSKLTTIRLGGLPIGRVRVEALSGFEVLPSALERLGGSPVVLGRGSNILAHDGNLPLVLVELGEAFVSRQPEVVSENEESITLRLGAGTPLQLLLNRLLSMGLGGLGGLAGIPGQLGGAVAMNAGSFGDTIGNCLSSVSLFSPALGNVSIKAEDLELGYRRFVIPQLAEPDARAPRWFIIHGAEFVCPKQPREDLEHKVATSLEKKRASQPLGASSAGCIFKNPELAPAGKLLEEAGLKGRSRSGMSFSQVHANFMVNDGNGTSDNAFELIDEARNLVRERFGVKLELEVRIWP